MTARQNIIFIGVSIGLLFLGFIFNSLQTTSSRTNAIEVSAVTKKVPQKAKSIRVGLQVGHWKNDELPDEFSRLRAQGGGSTVGNLTEWEVILEIAKRTASLLEEKKVIVELIPATIPIGYDADLFVTIHADGNDDSRASGFKVAGSDFDRTGKAQTISDMIEQSYLESTGMKKDINVTFDMTRYYAFNYLEYHHTISRSTPGVIVETGFLTNFQDRLTIVSQPDRAARGIANGILEYFNL